MENIQMFENCPSSNIVCDICGKEVEILNNDLLFSRELHNQSHKKLSDVNRLIAGGYRKKPEKKLDAVKNYSQNNHCSTCNKHFQIVNNDFELSLQLHSQNHELKECTKQIQNKEKFGSNNISPLDEIFNSFSPGLKSHRHFVIELDENSAFCKVCDLEISNSLNISYHLKTKLHEDNTLLSLKQILPSSLHDVMEFVSFFGSQLFCNLCNSTIILCSNNIQESVLNVITHNSSEPHLKYKTNSHSQEQYVEACSVLKDLVTYENSTNKFKCHIELKMVPQFICKLCNINIVYDENKTRMLNILTKHLQSSNHRILHNALVIEDFELAYNSSDSKHKFIPKDDGVLCSACNILIKANIGELLSHIKQTNCCKKLNNVPDLTDECLQLPAGSSASNKPLEHVSNNLSKKCKIKNQNGLTTLQEQFLEFIPLKESVVLNPPLSNAFKNENYSEIYDVKEKLDKVLNTLPKISDISCIKTNELGQVICIVCKCILSISDITIMQHLSGARHRNNKEETVVNSLFENIPENLHGNKSFIKVIAEDKSLVLCNKCNLKIPAHHHNLLEHLRGAYHIGVLTKPTEEQAKKEDKSEIAKLTGIQNKNTCERIISKNDLGIKFRSETSELKCILDDLSEQFDTSCIKINEKREITCVICNCPLQIHNDVIKEHLAGLRHNKNEKKKVVISLFENIPVNLKWNKSFINVPLGDKTHVFCNKCNVKIPAHYTNLLEHLQGTSHVRAFTKPIEEHSKNDDKSVRANLPELQQTKTCEDVISKNDLVEHFSSLSVKVSSLTSELKYILDDLSEQFETSCIKLNEKREVTCVICNCPVQLQKDSIKEHLAGLRHKEKKKKKVVEGLFGNIPENLQGNKSFISVMAGNKSYVFCSKCNVLILAHHKYLLEHLEGASHIRAFTKPIEGKTKKHNKSEIAKLPGIQNTKTCERIISKNELGIKVSSETSELKCILDGISQQFETSCITMNEKGQVICVICNCPVQFHKDVIKEHLAGLRHKENEEKKVIDGVFENIPENLKWNKSFINVPLGDKTHVFCNKCNVKIPAQYTNLLEHLQGASHIKALTTSVEGHSKNDDKSLREKLLELQQTKTCEEVISKNGLFEQFSLLISKIIKLVLKCELHDLSEQFDTSCITMNEQGEITCIICNCPLQIHINVIKEHLAGLRHKKNEKKNVVNSFFENIPVNLKWNKSFINVPLGDKTHVFCNKCNVKIPAQYTSLLEHLQGASHIKAFTTSIEGHSKNGDKSLREELLELQQTKTFEEVISKNEFSLLISKTSKLELKCILDDLSEQFDISCITMNEQGEITCVICNCPLQIRNVIIKEHLAGLRHKTNEKKKVVNSLFENIPVKLKWNKPFINVPAGDNTHVFCNKCNFKIPAHYTNLLEHLQGASHIRLLTSELKCILDDLSEQFETSCITINEKGELACVICNLTFSFHDYVIKHHLELSMHEINEKKKDVNSLFVNSPENLQGDKSFINVPAGDKSNCFLQ